MATVKFTKNEMNRLQKKRTQLKKYLPTLQLKKMLLQAEVNKARENVTRAERLYKEEILTFETSTELLSESSVMSIKKEIIIDQKVLENDNIAGIEVPTLSSVTYKRSEESFQHRPFWQNDMVEHLKAAKTAFLKFKIAVEKKLILDEELRSVSIRVNLFEKRLIPETDKDICRIKVFLGDQDLAAVSLSKLAKEKIEARKALEEGMIA